MKLYYNPMSTYSQKVLIALHEKGADFERSVVKLREPESRAAYLEMHPLGKLPLLVLPNGHHIPESSIIIEYLDGHYPEKPCLIPVDTELGRKVRFHDRITDLYVNDAGVTLLFNHLKVREFLPRDIETAEQRLTVTLGYLDKALAEGEFVCGSQFSMADCALIPSLFYLESVHPFAHLASLSRYWQAMQRRPSYHAVQEEFLPMWKAMSGG